MRVWSWGGGWKEEIRKLTGQSSQEDGGEGLHGDYWGWLVAGGVVSVKVE